MRPFTHHTHSCPLCRVARRTATKDRHVCRFRASFWMVPQVCCMVLSSASTVRRQVFLGLHLLRFPSGVQWRAVLVILSCSLLMTCPIVSGLVETVLDVIPCSSIMPYCAAQVSELFSCWQVFSVHLNWCRVGHVQRHHSCLLLADPQANLLCVSADSGRLFLHVLVSMGDQS